MATPYIGEIRMFAGSFAPSGWAFCDGSLQLISENDALFALIGTTYGGNGQTTFALPNLLGRVPVHQGNGYVIGQSAGTETVTVTSNQMPIHNHNLTANSNTANQAGPTNNYLAQTSGPLIYKAATPGAGMGNAIINTGGNQPHENMQPYLCISFIISLYGVYPSS